MVKTTVIFISFFPGFFSMALFGVSLARNPICAQAIKLTECMRHSSLHVQYVIEQ